MGNVTEVFRDITEDGNVWEQDKILVPSPPAAFCEDAVPSLFWIPQAPKLNQCVRSESFVALEASDTSRLSFDELPEQVVLQTSSGSPSNRNWDVEHRALGSRAEKICWRTLGSCAALHGHCLMTEERVLQLRPHLPLPARVSDSWKLLYSPRVHGVSISTFFRQCQAWPGETLLLVEDTAGTVFGGFASHTWHVQQQQQLHYGRHECFVFSFGPSQEHSPVAIYRWAGGNEYFLFANMRGLKMGGGRSPALWIDSDFLKGESAPCETFGNTSPLSGSREFVVRQFECWGFHRLASHTGSAWNTIETDSSMELATRLRGQAADALSFERRQS